MTDKILPLGSVVTLKNGDDTEVMIVSRASVIEVEDGQGGTKSVYFDYGSVVIPNGMQTPDNLFFFNRENVKEAVYFFNKENIKEVLFKGYRNKDEEAFEEHYDTWMKSAEVPKGSI